MFVWGSPFAGVARRLGLEPAEGRRFALMGLLVAVLLCAYTIAKVLRDALFLVEFGPLALPYAYLAVALASVGFVWIEAVLARRFGPAGASYFSQYLAIACSVAAALVYPHERHWTAAVFYIWTGSQAMMLLPHFWMLALEVWDSRRARTLFPLLAGCGLLGGLAGGGFAGWSSPFVSRFGLLWVLPVLLGLAHVLTRGLAGGPANSRLAANARSTVSPWKIVGRSPYLRVFVVVLALSVIVGTLVDFQFKLFLREAYPDPHELTQFLGRFYFVLNALSLVFQFGVAGWLMRRIGLGVSTSLQPITVLGLALWVAVAPGMWVMAGLRWVQGVLSQTLGKSTQEIYYTAIRPSERSRVKPAIDTLVERWSDAAVGVLLIVVLDAVRAPVVAIAILTAVLSGVWVVLLFGLDRQYGRAFQRVLSSHWIEPDEVPGAMRVPAVRRALLDALRESDESRIVFVLGLSGQAKDPRIALAVRECLAHTAPAVRAAAVTAMATLGLSDGEGRVAVLLTDGDEDVRQSAVSYLLHRGADPVATARRLLDGPDVALHRYVVEALFVRGGDARSALTPEWIETRARSETLDDVLLAARALGAADGPATLQQLIALLGHRDLEVRRVCLISAARRPSHALLGTLVPILTAPGLFPEARIAVAAIGDPAVSELEKLLEGAPDARVQSLLARTFAQIGGARAVTALMAMVRSSDVRARYFGLRGLARVRVRAGQPILARDLVHRLFLRELGEVRDGLHPAAALDAHLSPEVQLLASSCRESAEMALERALQALACWYEPRPLAGVFERLKSRDRAVTSPALDYLEHILPRTTFGSVRRMFETAPPTGEGDPLPAWIASLGKSEDGWLRACAVRASRHLPALDPSRGEGDEADPRVIAELEARRAAGTRWLIRPAASAGAAC